MKYGLKHPVGTQADPVISEALSGVADNARVTCRSAHRLAAELKVTPAEIGKTMDLLELRIVECQMGIFGYQPHKKILEAAESVPTALHDHLQSVAPGGEISCATCWEVADAFGVEKRAVAAACERMGLKIKPCQLGAF